MVDSIMVPSRNFETHQDRAGNQLTQLPSSTGSMRPPSRFATGGSQSTQTSIGPTLNPRGALSTVALATQEAKFNSYTQKRSDGKENVLLSQRDEIKRKHKRSKSKTKIVKIRANVPS